MARPKKRRGRRAVLHGRFVILSRPRVKIDQMRAWFALWCRANRERQAERALADAGLAAYRPLELRRLTSRGRVVEVERPPVGRYLFVGLDGHQRPWHVRQALDLPFDRPLASLIRTEFGPLGVPADLLQVFEDAIAGQGEPVQGCPAFEAGQRVRVMDGPFASFYGLVEGIDDMRVRGLIDIFGRMTPVEFEPGQLEAA